MIKGGENSKVFRQSFYLALLAERQQAYDLFAPISSRFTEGFDTANLKDAKALVAELG